MPQLAQNQIEDWNRLQDAFHAYRTGDAAVVGGLFSELGKRLYRFFNARTHDASDSDDLTQATLLKIHVSRHSFNSALSLKTWVFTVAQRTLIDHWRKHSQSGAHESIDDFKNSAEVVSEQGILDLASQISLRRSLEGVLLGLKPSERSIVYLSVVEGLSMAELAHVVDSTEGAIKVKVHRLLKSLREQLHKEDIEGNGGQT